jgi:class 3 adenylate cyclase
VIPETRYVKTPDGVYIAYQVVGDGPVDVALDFHSMLSNVDLMWEEPIWRPFLTAIPSFARMILHDRRGLGESSRNVPPANLETRVSDQLAVFDAAGSEHPVLVGPGGAGGAMQVLFAATHPDRVSGLVWYRPRARATWAPDYPWGGGPAEFERAIREAETWGTPEHARNFAEQIAVELPGQRVTQEILEAYGRIFRNTATPDVAREIELMWWDTDVRAVLPAVQAPVAIVSTVNMLGEARQLASLLPNATIVVAEGGEGFQAVGPLLDAIRRVAGIESSPPEVETVLATVLFTDIVDSAALQAAVGDHSWRELIQAHHAAVRQALKRWRGVEADTAGDGFYATFDGPARAIKCALEAAAAVAPLGVEIRAGVHTGECEVADGKCTGLTVSIGARVAAAAGPGQVLVSQTVKDLVAGSRLRFTDLGERELKGVPGTWRLYEATAPD